MTPGSKPSASEYIPAPAARHRLNQIVPICVALVTLVFAAYWRVHNYDFVNYDDEAGILETPAIRTGLNAQNVRWAFSHVHMGNWQPLTNLSHMLDCQWFGFHAGPAHIENVLFHCANTVLLFLLLRGMTCVLWPAAFV